MPLPDEPTCGLFVMAISNGDATRNKLPVARTTCKCYNRSAMAASLILTSGFCSTADDRLQVCKVHNIRTR